MIVFIDETSSETPPSKSTSLLMIVSKMYGIIILLQREQAIKKASKDSESSLFPVYLLRIEQMSELQSFVCKICARAMTHFEMHIALRRLTTRVPAPQLNIHPILLNHSLFGHKHCHVYTTHWRGLRGRARPHSLRANRFTFFVNPV
jgi:hypothetical protein